MDHNHEHGGHEHHEQGHRFAGDPARLRSPQRLARLDVERVVALTLDGLVKPSVLDVGTGSAVFAEAFAAGGSCVAGIDISADMLAIAQQYVPAGEFKQAPAEALPFADGSFDLVFLGVVLHEADDPLAALKEARRVARNRVAVLEWPYRDEVEPPPLAHRLAPQRVSDLAAAAGLAELSMVQLDHVDLYLLTP